MLLVGLGNPGSDYAATRHNLGFILIDKLAEEERIAVKRRECNSLVGQGEVEGVVIRLAKPQTFMNLSGAAASCLLRKLESDAPVPQPAKQLVVISDDLALPLGAVRLRERGSAGGHNGLKSIINAIGTNEFIRLRMGIQPDHPVSDARTFVLESFRKPQREEVEQILDKAAKAVHSVLRDGIKKTMSVFNG